MKIKNNIKKTYKLLLMFILSISVYAIEITPAEFVYNLDSYGVTQDVVFYNRKDRAERVRVSFKPYQTDGDEKNLGKWATVFPKVITVAPGEQRIVKFSIEPPKGLKPGEYRGTLFMEELEQKSLSKVKGKVVIKQGTTSQVNMLINLSVGVFGYIGDPNNLKVSGKVGNMKRTGNTINFILENNGEITKPYQYILKGKDKNGKEITKEEKLVVIQGYKENIRKDLPKDMRVTDVIIKDFNGVQLGLLKI